MADCIVPKGIKTLFVKDNDGIINNGDWVKVNFNNYKVVESRLHEADEVGVTEVVSNLEFIIDNKVGKKNQVFRDMILGKKK